MLLWVHLLGKVPQSLLHPPQWRDGLRLTLRLATLLTASISKDLRNGHLQLGLGSFEAARGLGKGLLSDLGCRRLHFTVELSQSVVEVQTTPTSGKYDWTVPSVTAICHSTVGEMKYIASQSLQMRRRRLRLLLTGVPSKAVLSHCLDEALGGLGVPEVDESVADAVLVAHVHWKVEEIVAAFEAQLVDFLHQGPLCVPAGYVPQHDCGHGLIFFRRRRREGRCPRNCAGMMRLEDIPVTRATAVSTTAPSSASCVFAGCCFRN
mmetsp:Transcript_96979/g.134725  ORF Transcript_96979/g.134725 Transcript_96979/m.134725 type:complete len:264 (-) Transcript_96979:50-841(-)